MRDRFAGWLQWLLPGLGVKRWLLLAAFGVVVLFDAVARWLIAEGTEFTSTRSSTASSTTTSRRPISRGFFGVVGIALRGRSALRCGCTRSCAIARGRSPKGFLDALAGRRLAARLQDRRDRRRHGSFDAAARPQAPHQQPHRGRDRQRRRRLFGPPAKRTRRSAAGRHPQLSGRARRRRSAGDRSLPLPLYRRRRPQRPLVRQSLSCRDDRHHRQLRRAIKESSRVLNINGRVLPATLGVVQPLRRARRRHDRRRRVEHLRWRSARSSASSSIRRGGAARRSDRGDSRRRRDRARARVALHLGRCRTSWSIASRAKSPHAHARKDVRLQRDDATRRDRRHDARPITSKRCLPTPASASATT